MSINQNNSMCSDLYAHVTHGTKGFAQRKRGVWLGKWQYAKPSPKKSNLDNAIDYRLKNHLIPHEKIVEKFALEMTVSAFRKACSRAKPKESLGPTPAKAPPTSEPTAPTPHKYPRGELHERSDYGRSIVVVGEQLEEVRSRYAHVRSNHRHPAVHRQVARLGGVRPQDFI